MASVLAFDIGCLPPPIQYQIEHPSELTRPEEGFIVGRRYAEPRGLTLIRLSDVPPEAWTAVLTHWNRTLGGTLLMDFTPPDGGPLRVVRFARAPQLQKRGARMVSFSVELEDAP